MMPIAELKKAIARGDWDATFSTLYTQEQIQSQRERYLQALEKFESLYGPKEVAVFSAPGRTEIIGNHTDHNHGRVLAASVNLDIIAVAAYNSDGVIRLQSEGHDANRVELSLLEPIEAEKNTSNALIRGICARCGQLGIQVGGMDVFTTSQVLRGSGLSSSAAFEVVVGTLVNVLYGNEQLTPVAIAQIGQYAENRYFGKPCGLMDQTACSVGGFVAIDFKNPIEPEIRKIQFDFAGCGYNLCIVDTGGNHADLTEDYASVPVEMKQVASYFGEEVLRQVKEEEFWDRIGELRGQVSDRAIIRAIHFFQENRRAQLLADVLEEGDFPMFKKLLVESGRSSFMYNQNVYTVKNPQEQGLSLALAVAEHLLAGRGAYRVHGGGFAGTIQAFVPQYLTQEFAGQMDAIFGEQACKILSIRPVGGCQVMG